MRLFKFISLSSLFLLSLAKSNFDQCAELQKETDAIDECEMNSKGYATYISFIPSDNEIKENIFNKLEAVKELRIQSCNLTQTNINEIATLSSLHYLYISEVNYKDLDLSPFENLKNLKELYFYGDKEDKNKHVTEFPSFLFKLEDLEELYISDHVISSSPTVPKEIANLKNLKTLSLSIDITGSLEPLSKLENLEELIISYANVDSEIPESLNNLKKLHTVDFYESGIRGKALTNDSLKHCRYGANSNVCKTKDMVCFRSSDKLKNCENVSDDVISTNGRCGNGNGKCPVGECCSKYGHCGKSEKYCYPSKGCQANLGDCYNYPVSTNGKCGKEDGRCPNGECCSKNGQCGTSESHCLVSNKCQSEFGKCKEDQPKNSRCGSKYGNCPRGQCCNKDGYCGITKDHCSVSRGCQNAYGECYAVNSSKCGDYVGRCPEGQCCSKYNWCGRSDSHCGKGCQSEFGDCK